MKTNKHQNTQQAPATNSSDQRSLGVPVLAYLRQQRNLSRAALAKLAGVSEQAVKDTEAGKLSSLRLGDVVAIAKALGRKLTVVIQKPQPPLPRSNAKTLAAFDRLLKQGRCNFFVRKAKDREHPGIYWDVVGDCDIEWLYVVASNPRRKVRFAKVTDEFGGWSIRGQIFGIDAETEQIAQKLCDQLLNKHLKELT